MAIFDQYVTVFPVKNYFSSYWR